MKKYIIIIAIIIASMASVFGQHHYSRGYYRWYGKKAKVTTINAQMGVTAQAVDTILPFNSTAYNPDTIVSDSSFTVKNLMGQDVFTGEGEWTLENPTTTEQVKNAYGVELQSGVYFIYRNGKEEGKFIVR